MSGCGQGNGYGIRAPFESSQGSHGFGYGDSHYPMNLILRAVHPLSSWHRLINWFRRKNK
jgi:hypothetical protein